MGSGSFRFEEFSLDPVDRMLRRDGEPVELNARYLDALALLVREQGSLVSKGRFLEEIWRGVPVTDEALTQCIRTLRRQLGDDAAAPRFIQTVPKHGYRFIAPVQWVDQERESRPAVPVDSAPEADPPQAWRTFLLLGAAGMVGGGGAGIIGGLIYGFGAASQDVQTGMGATSVLLVVTCLTMLIAMTGGAGVSFGIAAAGFAPGRRWLWTIAGGALGGMIVGALVKLLGLDAFDLLFGQSPRAMTGALEGALLGAAVGFGAWLAERGAGSRSLGLGVTAAALVGGAAGVLICLLGGRLMGGSLDLLARSFPHSRLRLDQLGGLFGERTFGPVSQIATGGAEGMLFSGSIVGVMMLARRRLGANGWPSSVQRPPRAENP